MVRLPSRDDLRQFALSFHWIPNTRFGMPFRHSAMRVVLLSLLCADLGSPMADVLNKATVLVLNRNWQAINIRTPADAFCQMASGTATGLEVNGEEDITPMTWDQWIKLPIRSQDNSVLTVRGPIRIPSVIVAVNYSRVPMRRPSLNARAIRERDGNRCQYTGLVLRSDEGSIDHIVPRSRGGKDTWDNCVWSSKEINNRKGNRLPQEAGLKLIRSPRPPSELPVTAFIRNYHGIADWRFFVAD